MAQVETVPGKKRLQIELAADVLRAMKAEVARTGRAGVGAYVEELGRKALKLPAAKSTNGSAHK